MSEDWGFGESSGPQRSNLGGLFGGSNQQKADFTHKRPVQPGQAADPAKKGDVQSIFALPAPGVFLYKTDSSGESALACDVPVGVALLFDQQRHFLYFYKTKTEPLLNIYLNSKFQFAFQESQGVIYASFTDAEKRNWSISFQSQEQADLLTMHVALIVFLYTNRSDVVKFVTNEGSGEALSEGDTAGIYWTGYTVSGKKVGGQFGSNEGSDLMRVELGKGAAIEGLERALVGEGNKSKFVVVIPAHMTDRKLEPSPPDNQTLVFCITVDRVKRVPRAASRTPAKEAVDSTPLPFIEDVPKAGKPRTVSSARKSQTRQPKAAVVTTEEEDSDDGRPSQSHQKPFSYTNEPRHEPAPQQHQQPNQYGQPPNQNQPQYGQPPNQYGHPQPIDGRAPGSPYPNQPGYPPQQYPGQQPPNQPYSNALAFPTPQPAPAPGGFDPYNPYGQPGFPGQPSPYGQPAPAPAPAPTPLPKPSQSGIPTDTLQLMVDERQYKSQIDNKMNTMLVKVDRLTEQVHSVAQTRRAQSDTHTSSGISAKALLNTITRIVVDNERLQNESNEKSKTIAQIRDELSKLRNEKQAVIEENAAYVEGRTKNFSEFTLAHRKKQDALTEEKEQIQIELSELQAKAASQQRKYDTLRSQFKALSEELKTTQADSLRANEARQKSKNEADASLAELGAFKQKYREENRKMTEALTEVEKLTHELKVANEKLDSQAEKIKQQSTDHVLQLQQIDAQRVEERTNLNEQIEQLKTLIRSERQQTRAKYDEMEEGFEAQRKEDRAALRAYVETELTRRVDIAVGDAVSQEQAKHSAELQQALLDARKVALEDRTGLLEQMDQLEKVLRIEREQTRQQIEDLERNHQEQKDALKVELETEFNAKLEQEKEAAAQEQQRRDTEQAEALAAAASAAEKDRNDLNETISQLSAQLKEARDHLQASTSALEAAKAQNEAANAQIGALNEAHQQLKENSVLKSSIVATPAPAPVETKPEPTPVQKAKKSSSSSSSEEDKKPKQAEPPKSIETETKPAVVETAKPEEPAAAGVDTPAVAATKKDSSSSEDDFLKPSPKTQTPAKTVTESLWGDDGDDDFGASIKKPASKPANPFSFDGASDDEDDSIFGAAAQKKPAAPAKPEKDPFADEEPEVPAPVKVEATPEPAPTASAPAPADAEQPPAPVDAKPEEPVQDAAAPEEAAKPEEPKPEEPAQEVAKPEEPAQVEEPAKPEEPKPEEPKVDEPKQPEEVKPEEPAQDAAAAPEEPAKPEETKPEETQTTPVEEPKPEEPAKDEKPAEEPAKDTKPAEEPAAAKEASDDDEFFSTPSTPVKKQPTTSEKDIFGEDEGAPPLPDDDNTKSEEPKNTEPAAPVVEEPPAPVAVETKPEPTPGVDETGVAPEPSKPEEPAAAEPEKPKEAEETTPAVVAPPKEVDPFADPFETDDKPKAPAANDDPFADDSDPFSSGTPSKATTTPSKPSDPFGGDDDYFGSKPTSNTTTPTKKAAWGFDGSDDDDDPFFKPTTAGTKKPTGDASLFFDAKPSDLDFPIGKN